MQSRRSVHGVPRTTRLCTVEPVIVSLGTMALFVLGAMAAVLVAKYGWHLI